VVFFRPFSVCEEEKGGEEGCFVPRTGVASWGWEMVSDGDVDVDGDGVIVVVTGWLATTSSFLSRKGFVERLEERKCSNHL
jgi:hypothetical protein